MSFAVSMAAPFCWIVSCPVLQGLQGSGTSAKLTCSIHDGFGMMLSL